MNKFDEDLYSFATAEENFKDVFEIATKFDFFKEKLIHTFWSNVLANLKPDEKNLKGWLPWQEGNFFAGLYHPKYSDKFEQVSIASCFYPYGSGKVMLGIYFDKDINTSNYENVIKVASKIATKSWRPGPKSDTFPIYKLMDDNFNSYETLRKIIPSEGDWLAREYAENLMDAHIELYPFIEKFGIKFN